MIVVLCLTSQQLCDHGHHFFETSLFFAFYIPSTIPRKFETSYITSSPHNSTDHSKTHPSYLHDILKSICPFCRKLQSSRRISYVRCTKDDLLGRLDSPDSSPRHSLSDCRNSNACNGNHLSETAWSHRIVYCKFITLKMA